MLQYITPTLQFILGITVLGEAMSTPRWIGFFVIWIAVDAAVHRYAPPQSSTLTGPDLPHFPVLRAGTRRISPANP
jgi:hypothetical protein